MQVLPTDAPYDQGIARNFFEGFNKGRSARGPFFHAAVHEDKVRGDAMLAREKIPNRRVGWLIQDIVGRQHVNLRMKREVLDHVA